MFAISGNDPTKLTLLDVVDSQGEFPVSVAVSAKLGMACVLNGGAKNGVACFKVSKGKLVKMDVKQRNLKVALTTPPSGPLGTVSQVLFNPQSTALHVTVKGVPGKTDGFLSTFAVENKTVSATEKRVNPAGSLVLFGAAFVNDNQLLITDAAFGAVSINTKNPSNITNKVTIDGQAATCWAAVSEKTKSAFVTDVAKGKLVEIDPLSKDGNKTILGITELTKGNVNGLIDLVAGGNFIYALAPGQQGISVFDVSTKGKAKEIQFMPFPSSLGTQVQGMTV
ncbi:hypothetical protein HK096_007816 [Nowakowskiella sp. JEL0078]|nr:hypothetical protein HK096_007816 [Nowakowskiella sp. JEL0078]